MDNITCPNCGSAGTCEPFYEALNVPTNSCLLVADRDQALHFPTGSIVLALCGECGFVFNAAWDPKITVYSDQYEETQGFSATFNRFNRGIAEKLINDYDIREKTVLEIGCGKGEFVSLMCQLGGNRGIGYDPSFIPARQTANENVRYVREFFTPETRELPPDLVCCKMTLEHIGQTQQFLTAVRAVATRKDSIIFFQVPSVDRILKEAAFWDIYYEHCSYFSSASLQSLFESTGFSVLRLWTGFDDQYLMIVASPSQHQPPVAIASSQSAIGNASDLTATIDMSKSFATSVTRRRAAWSDRLRSWASYGERTVLWGSGSKAVAFLTTLGIIHEIDHTVDINPYRVGKYLPGTGQDIVAPSFLREYRPDNVIIMNPVYLSEVKAELARQNSEPRVYTILDL